MKNRTDYFTLFEQQSAHCVQAAELLKDFMAQFDTFQVFETMQAMHRIEHEADMVRKTLTEKLSVEFLPPIEREDILALANELDNVTDAVEDTLRHLYMFNIESVTPDAVGLADVVLEATRALYKAVTVLRSFKKSGKLQPFLLTVNELEEKSDELYTEAVRSLYCSTNDPRQLLRWTKIYGNLESCCDACSHAAEVMETVMFKNS